MKRILLETNAYTALMSGSREIADALNTAEEVLLSVVVIGELLDGFLGGSRNGPNREIGGLMILPVPGT